MATTWMRAWETQSEAIASRIRWKRSFFVRSEEIPVPGTQLIEPTDLLNNLCSSSRGLRPPVALIIATICSALGRGTNAGGEVEGGNNRGGSVREVISDVFVVCLFLEEVCFAREEEEGEGG